MIFFQLSNLIFLKYFEISNHLRRWLWFLLSCLNLTKSYFYFIPNLKHKVMSFAKYSKHAWILIFYYASQVAFGLKALTKRVATWIYAPNNLFTSLLTHLVASFYVLQDFNLVKIFWKAPHIFKILVMIIWNNFIINTLLMVSTQVQNKRVCIYTLMQMGEDDVWLGGGIFSHLSLVL